MTAKDSTRTRVRSVLVFLGVAVAFALLGFALRHLALVPTGGLFISALAVVVLVAVRQPFAQRELLSTNQELERTHAELATLATTDPITALPNHRALVTALDKEIARSQRRDLTFAVVFLDVDDFKTLNDSAGHAAGDKALSELGAVMRSCLRAMDTVGRWGGKEFVALLPDTDADAAMVLSHRLRAAIAARAFSISEWPHLTCSLGVAIYPGDGLARTDLIEAADRAMYAAKRFGRNQVFAAADPVVGALADATDRETALAEDALAGAVDVLAVLVDERHNNSGAHASNVADLAGRLAVELGCDPSQSSAIRVAARLHDIGKIAIPDAILLKPSALTDSEWAQMKEHPVVGSDVLSLIPALRSIAPMVRAHHERWDGTGYPDGLAGKEIPLPARILCLADAFDAMIAGRPYSEPMHEAAALREVKRCAGTQFDPRVVMAMEHIYCPDANASRACNGATEHGAVLGHSELIHQA